MIYNRSGMFKRVDDIRKKDFRDEAKAVKDNFDDKDIADEKYEEMIDNSKEAVYEKAMESTRYIDVGRVNARLYVSGEKVEGFISCNYEETVDEMTKVADIFGEGVKAVYSKDAGTPAFYRHPMKDNSAKVSSVELYKTAKKFLDNLK